MNENIEDVQQATLNSLIPTEKIYNDKEISLGTFLGGPLAAGYFIAQNFNEFGDTKKSKLTWLITIVITIVIFGGLLFIPFIERFPSQIIPLFYTSFAYLIFRIYQGERTDSHIKQGGQVHSWWRVIGVSLISLVVTLAVVLGLALATTPTEKTKTYEKINTDITYVEGNITENEVDSIAQAFEKTSFAADRTKFYFYVEKARTNYEFSLAYDNAGVIDEALIKDVRSLRDELQKHFPDNKIVFKLLAGTTNKVVQRIE